MTKIAVIINPISGTGGSPEVARQRAVMAAACLDRHGLAGDVFVTERTGHARELARASVAGGVAGGVSLVAAWGGDGTVNEVGSVLAFGPIPLLIIPSGSGNGLASELGLPRRAADTLELLRTGHDRRIDAGEIDGRLFFNVAGIGLDARVAQRFAENRLRRGFLRYLQFTAQELFNDPPDAHVIATESEVIRARTMLIAIANGRQYGNGALIAPSARLDDGRLEVVVIRQRSPIEALFQVPRVFAGQIERVRGVTTRSAERVRIDGSGAVVFHVDGEPYVGGATLEARVHAGALSVRVPAA